LASASGTGFCRPYGYVNSPQWNTGRFEVEDFAKHVPGSCRTKAATFSFFQAPVCDLSRRISPEDFQIVASRDHSRQMVQRNGLTYQSRLTIPNLTQKKEHPASYRFGGNS
jgi:hypothetical protein